VQTDFGAGNSVQLSAYRVADAVPGYAGQTNRLYNAVIQGSNDGSTWVTLDTIPNVPFYARYNMAPRNQRSLSPAVPYRYYRFAQSGTYGECSELQWIGPAGAAGISARPVQPVITPGAGVSTAGTIQITITSTTASASIYYTTDGTTPTNTNGTLYTGPLLMTAGAVTVLQAVAYDSTLATNLSDVAIGHYRNYAFAPNDDWYDDDGLLIEAHAPHIIGPIQGRYYMTGQFANKGNAVGADIGANEGVWMYSSPDMLNWHFEGQILDNGASAGTSWNYVERPNVLFNSCTNRYVLWAHMANSHDGSDRAGIATAFKITGPWTWQNVTLDPDNNGFKDFSLFQEDDGTAYVAYVTGTQGSITISRLRGDYQGTTGASLTGLAAGTEAPMLWKRQGKYFLMSSSTNYYNSVSGTFNLRYITCPACSSPLGAWNTSYAYVLSPVPSANQPYNCQSSAVLNLVARQDALLLLCDFYNPTSLYSSRQSWVPISFPTSSTAQGLTLTSWDLTTWVPVPKISISSGTAFR